MGVLDVLSAIIKRDEYSCVEFSYKLLQLGCRSVTAGNLYRYGNEFIMRAVIGTLPHSHSALAASDGLKKKDVVGADN
ncbi:hypothetical protein [Noviherbaspirillum aridicola]|nr:hypothetical protein [Noviherbaspirillum aridicola]